MIDHLDQQLILELSKDGRKSYKELALQFNITDTTVRKRVKNLLDSGLMKVAASLSPEALGYNFTAIMGMQIRPSDIKVVAEQLSSHPNICYVVNVTGRFDFMIIVLTRSSKEFAILIEQFISDIPGIIRTETFVTLNTFKGRATGLDTLNLVDSLEAKTNKRGHKSA